MTMDFFDWANQAYALTVMTVIAPALMAALSATGTQSGDTFYAWVLTISMIFVVVNLGVIADKMPLLKWYSCWYPLALTVSLHHSRSDVHHWHRIYRW